MFSTIFGEFPVSHYTHNNYSRAIDSLANDVLSLTSSIHTLPYSLKEFEGDFIFNCVATSITKENLSIAFKDRKLFVKTVSETKDLPYFTPINVSLNLSKDIDVEASFAELVSGVLTVTMPIKKEMKENKINFK